MQAGWRTIAKTVVATALVTTTFWFVVAAWYLRQDAPPANRPAPDTPVVATKSPPPIDSDSERMEGPSPLFPSAAPIGGRMAIPVAGVKRGQLTNTFSQARDEGVRRHDAIDIMAARGTPVIAAAPGRVEKLFLSDDGGNTIYIRSADRTLVYYYAHLHRYAPRLREGQSVRRGQVLGTVGSTGNANPEAPHLHFAIWRMRPEAQWSENGAAINPYGLLTGQ